MRHAPTCANKDTTPASPPPSPGWESEQVYRQALSIPFAFPVLFTHQAFHPDNDTIRSLLLEEGCPVRRRVLVFVDEGVVRAWPDASSAIRTYFERVPGHDVVGPITPVAGGDACKDGLGVVEMVGRLAATYRIDRQSYILVIGGGAVLDAVGLGAALVHRGVRLIRMPSTVLGQNDAGVGVKNGVNAFGQKNFFGSFAPPYAVINDSALLHSLTRRDWMAGVAEAVKVACIKDHGFLMWLSENAARLVAREMPMFTEMIRRCAGLHLDHIRENGDPFEFGSARPLDFGHWSAHWLEMESGGTLTHGEAVAIGIALDSAYAAGVGMLRTEEASFVRELLERLGFRLHHECLARLDAGGQPAVLAGLDHFREHLGGELTLTFPSPLGAKREVHDVRRDVMRSALASLAPPTS